MNRTTRFPAERPDDATWKELRAIACQAARFANLASADEFVARGKQLTGDDLRAVRRGAYGRMNDELSGWVRNAMIRTRVASYWKRSGRDVLAGRERLACFSADRALTILADQRDNQGALYEHDPDGCPVLVCRFRPASTHPPIRIRIAIESTRARSDYFIRDAVARIWSSVWLPGTVTLRFDRMRRKLDVLISWTSGDDPPTVDGKGATLGPLNPETGELWLRFDDDARPLNFAHRVQRMWHMKTHHEGLTHRLRRKMGQGRKRRQAYRLKLRKIGYFSTWARDRMHELSAEVVKACQSEGVSVLRISGLGEGDLPWHRLSSDLAYKCETAGIKLEKSDVKQDATAKAERAEIRKRVRSVRKAREGVRAVTELLSSGPVVKETRLALDVVTTQGESSGSDDAAAD